MSAEGTLVDVAISYPLIWGSGDLEICVEDKVFEVHFERRSRQEKDPPVFGSRLIEVSPGQELPYDRSGSVAHTELKIQFPMYVRHDIAHPEELYGWVHAVVNRLLDVYRYATEDFYVNNIPISELDVQRISRTLKEDGTLENRETLVGFQAVGPDRWLTQARTAAISEGARQFLREGAELSIPTVLYLNAKREYVFENYRIAVAEAETALEALVDQVVARYYKGQGSSNTKIENILKAPFKNIIRDHIPRCCGRAFQGTPVYSLWETELYTLRNDAVHDGAPVDANQAKRALDAAEQAIQWINTYCV